MRVSEKQRRLLISFYQGKLIDPFIDTTTKVLIQETIKVLEDTLV